MTNSVDYKHYSYHVKWSPEDGEYVGLCAEFSGLSWLAPDQINALKGIVQVVKDVVKDMEAAHEMPPSPLSERHFSGKFQVRVTPEQHRALVTEARMQHVSLNRLISSKL